MKIKALFTMILFRNNLILTVSEQILSPRRFCPPGHNLLAEIVPHGHNPLADIVPLPQILSPPPANRCLAVPVFFFVGVRSYKPRPLFCIESFSTHTPSPLLLPPISPAVLSIYLPARRPGRGPEYRPLRPSKLHVVRFAAAIIRY